MVLFLSNYECLVESNFENDYNYADFLSIFSCRGRAAKDTIYGNVGLGSVIDSIKGKLTQPHDVVEETRAAREHGGSGRASSDKGEERATVDSVASALKASDQMTGRAFKDVGGTGDEGVTRVRIVKKEKD